MSAAATDGAGAGGIFAVELWIRASTRSAITTPEAFLAVRSSYVISGIGAPLTGWLAWQP
jgi:hypothetical protein